MIRKTGEIGAGGPSWSRTGLLGVWIGLAYGALEAVATMALLPLHVLSWRSANGPDILWVAPVTYAAVFGTLGLVFGLAGRLTRPARAERALVFVLAGGSAFLAVTLPGRGIADWAAAILALGTATMAVRLFRGHRARIWRLIRVSLPPLAVATVAAMALVRGLGSLAERRAMAELSDPGGSPPNVLLIVIDTQRADHMSLYGYERPTTPALEDLARSSLVFDAAYANSSWTLPSHASLFTGRLPFEHRAGELRRPYLDDRHRTLAEGLRARGYATGGFVANVYWCSRPTGLDRGFIRYEDLYGNPGDALVRTVLGRRLAYEVLPRFGRVEMPGRKRADRINRDVLEWIDGLEDRPFFAFLNYFDVHGPYLPPEPFAGRFAGDGAAERMARQRARGRIELGALTGDIELPSPEELEEDVAAYDESILFLDAQLERLFDALDDRGLLDRTLVIVTSDHGESFGEHGLLHHGHSLYLDQLHVPLLMRLPERVPEGRRVAAAVGIERLPATIMELTGGSGADFPGGSLARVWDTAGTTGLDTLEPATAPVLAEVARRSMTPASWPSSRGWVRAALTERWHYILEESGDEELFDLRTDRAEEHDLVGTDEGDPVAARLRTALERAAGGAAARR